MEESSLALANKKITQFNSEFAGNVADVVLPLLEKYHRAEYRGLDNIPADGPFVSVGNHGGVHFMPEALLWITKYHSEGRKVPLLTLSNPFINFVLEKVGLPMGRLGVVDDSPEAALMALESGYAIATYPGADRDLSKPYSERNKIEFFGNVSYVRAAIASQKPIVPVVGCGGGETVYTLNGGETIAEKFKLDELFGIKSWPTFWSFPRGLHTGHMPHFSIPIPSKIIISVLPPILTQGYEPSDADDPETVRELHTMVMGLMQKELDEISEGRVPVIG